MFQAATSSNTQHVKISNSFNELIPYVYENRETKCSNDFYEKDTRDPKDLDLQMMTNTAQTYTISAKQKKKEAKA